MDAGVIHDNGNIDLERIDKKERKDVEEYITKVFTALSSRAWRMKHLYKVEFKKNAGDENEEDDDKLTGEIVTYKPNKAQRVLLANMHPLVLIPKSRQRGITTHECLVKLDGCIFSPPERPLRVGVLADTQKNATKIFKHKIKEVYERLPKFIKKTIYPTTDSAMEIQFSNGSHISVGVTYIGQSLDDLHLSEMGVICQKYPERADEIVRGAFNTVAVGQRMTVEGTGRGTGGWFHEQCMKADKMQKEGRELTDLDWKLIFFAWWDDPSCVLEARDVPNVVITQEMEEYFEKVEVNENIKLKPEQKAWYVKKSEQQGDKMHQEYPSFLEECFEEDLEGAYYSKQFIIIRKEKRITKVPFMQGSMVHTGWDIGVDDMTAIWFAQIIGREIHLIDFYENSDEQLGHYAWVLKDKENTLGYKYESHIAPHDIKVREWGSEGDRLEMARRLYGIKFYRVLRGGLSEGIEITRQMLSQCVFDESRCERGIRSLENYKKKWNDQLGKYEDNPQKSPYNHGADAFRTLMVRLHQTMYGGEKRRTATTRPAPSSRGWT